jgi:putative transposase
MKLMDRDVEAIAGPKGKHNPNRVAYRHGYQATTVPMGSQRIAITRPRVRSLDIGSMSYLFPVTKSLTMMNELLVSSTKPHASWHVQSRLSAHGIEDYTNIAETSGRSKSTISQSLYQI